MGEFVGEVFGNSADAQVVSGMAQAENRSTEAMERAVDAVESLTRNRTRYTVNVNGDLDPIDTSVDDMSLPNAPVAPALNLVLPQFPSDINVASIPDISVGAVPEFTATAPALSFPDRPDDLAVTSPGDAPATDFDSIIIPDAPVVVLPPVPTLEELNIPTAPVLDFPTLDQPVPTTNLVRPDNNFAWAAETPYASDKLTTLCDTLVERVTNSGGLSSEAESQIWDRARNREQIGEDKARSEILRDSAQQGFSRPTGSMTAALDAATFQFQQRVAELNREIAIKQAELAEEGVRHAISEAITLERALIDSHNQIQSRALDAAKFAQQTALELFNAEVGLFNLELEVYRAFVLAFETGLKVEIEKLNAYRIELEAENVKNGLNETTIRLYTARLQGLETSVDVYTKQLNGVESQVAIENAKLTAYKTEVDAFSAVVGAKTAEFQSYGEAVRAETAKATTFEIEAKAFASRIQAYAAEVGVERSKSDLKVQTEQLKITQQGLKLDTFSKTVDAKVAAYQTQISEFQGRSQIYSAEVGAEAAKVNARISSIQQKTQYAQVKSQVAIENAKIFLANIDREAKLSFEVAKGAADVSAQLAASSLSSLNYSAGIRHDLGLNSNLQETHSFDG